MYTQNNSLLFFYLVWQLRWVDPHLGCHSTCPKPSPVPNLHYISCLDCTALPGCRLCVSPMLPCPSHRTPAPSDVGLVERRGEVSLTSPVVTPQAPPPNWQILPRLSCQCRCPSECKTHILPQLPIWTFLVPLLPCSVRPHEMGESCRSTCIAVVIIYTFLFEVFLPHKTKSHNGFPHLSMFKTNNKSTGGNKDSVSDKLKGNFLS